MTFTEAAMEVLRREGKPLHFKVIAEIAVRDSLLDHVGKIPEETMGGTLLSHAKLPHADRKMIPVGPQIFALVEWGLPEDPTGLEGLVEPPPEGEPPYRPKERHPLPDRDMAKSSGRGEGRRRREEREEGEGRRGKRWPPPSEVAYEILAGAANPLTLVEIAASGAERFLFPDTYVADPGVLGAALAEDNARRSGAGRKALFGIENDIVTLLAQPEPGERAEAAERGERGERGALPGLRPGSVADLRKSALAALKRRMRDCDGATVEYIVTRVLEKTGMRELKVAKRGRESVVFTGRKRLGLSDLRWCIRLVRQGDVGRREVHEVRRDLAHYGSQLAMIVAPGDANREARSDAVANGQAPVILLAGEALAEAMTEASVGAIPVVVPDIDESFFRTAADAAAIEEAARRARREERDRRDRDDRGGRDREDRGGRERPAPGGGPALPVEGAVAAEGGPPSEGVLLMREPGTGPVDPNARAAAGLESELDDESDDDDTDPAEGSPAQSAPVGGGGASGAPGEGGERSRRRRRRRRGRGRGRGGDRPREGGAPGGAPQPGALAGGTPAPSSEPPPPPPPASLAPSGEGSGQ